jgi:ribosomal-protein-alanine N-acetyltransferase
MKLPGSDIRKLSSVRIIYINSSVDIIEKILAGDEALMTHLDILIPPVWTEFGRPPFQYALERIQNHSSDPKWWSWLPILVAENTLIGNCGYKGAPKNGTVEIGYEVAEDYRGQGFGTEMAVALIKNAFMYETVQEVIAHTLAEENASVNILRKCGFTLKEQINDPEDGQIWKWELARADTVVKKK